MRLSQLNALKGRNLGCNFMPGKQSVLDKVNVHIAACTQGVNVRQETRPPIMGRDGGMAALHKRALYRLMVGGSVVAFTPALAQAQNTAPPPVDQAQATEEQRPTTANTSSADAPNFGLHLGLVPRRRRETLPSASQCRPEDLELVVKPIWNCRWPLAT